MSNHTYNMPSQLEAVDPMVLTLRSAVEKVVSNDTRFRFEICITEVLTNLVIHAQKKPSGTDIEIAMNLEAGHVAIEIFDPIGVAPFDPNSHAKNLSDIDAMAEGGRGIGLIMECADEVKYGQSGGRHRLALDFWDAPEPTHSQPMNGANP